MTYHYYNLIQTNSMNTFLRSPFLRMYLTARSCRLQYCLLYYYGIKQNNRKGNTSRQQKTIGQSIVPHVPLQAIHAKIDKEEWLSGLSQVQTLQSFMPYVPLAFSQSSLHLAQFLHYIYKYLTPETFSQHSTFFDEVDTKLNTFSSSLTLRAQDYIQILRFHAKYRAITNRIGFLHNFGFQKKASMLAATFIHKREMTFSQALLSYKLLASLGSINILFYMNFIKYFKEVTGKPDADIKLEQILTLLNIKFIKRNDIIIENTLFDHVLSYLLSHLPQMLKGQDAVIKVETLCTLLCIDCRNNYRSDSSTKKYWVAKLIGEITASLDNAWVKQMWKDEKAEGKQVGASEIVYILQCVSFTKRYMMEFQALQVQFKSFINTAYSLFERECSKEEQSSAQISKGNIQLLIRFLFSPVIAREWTDKKDVRERITKRLLSLQKIHQSALQPFTHFLHSEHLSPENKAKFLELACSILIKHLQKKILLSSLALAFIKHSTTEAGISLLKQKGCKAAAKIDDKSQLSFAFMQRFLKAKSLKQSQIVILQPSSVGSFIRNLYDLAVNSQSPKGYATALSLIEQHFDQLWHFLIADNDSSAARSQINVNLSQESYLITWIIFVNLANRASVFEGGMRIFQRIMKNDIIKYEILTQLYEHSFPSPNKAPSLLKITDDFPKTMTVLLEYFDKMDKYAYFIWDIFLKLYSTQPPAIREQSFPLLECCFLRAYKKENLRKVIMVTVLTNFISTGVITGSRLKLQTLFELAVDDLMAAEDDIEYHYSCYVQIVFNAISADILAPIYFDKIMLHSLKKDKAMKHTCSLMLMYGASLKARNEGGGVIAPQIIVEQTAYLKYLIRGGHIVEKRFQEKGPQRKDIDIDSRLVSILFSFGFAEIIVLEKQIYSFLEGHWDFAEWRCMVNSYTAENYSMGVRREALFRGRVNQIMIDKLICYMKLSLISKAEESYFIQKFK